MQISLFVEENEKKSEIQVFNREKMLAIFDEKIEIRERCKGVHCVDLGESFPTSVYLQNLASIQPRSSPLQSNYQQFRVKCYYISSHLSFRTPPVPSVFEDSPVYQRVFSEARHLPFPSVFGC